MGASRTACWDTADCSHRVWNTPEEGQEIVFFFFSIAVFIFNCWDASTWNPMPTSAVTGICLGSTCCLRCWKVPCCSGYQEAPCCRPSPWRGPVWGADKTHILITKQDGLGVGAIEELQVSQVPVVWPQCAGCKRTSCRSLVRRDTEICSCLRL